MQRVRSVFAVFTVVVASSTAFGWGHQGHEVVGAIADKMLKPAAATKVKSILGDKLRVGARWPDCAKDVVRTQAGKFQYEPDPHFHVACRVFETPDGIARMEDYVRRNWDACHPGPKDDPCHKQYHYADVATQHDRYDRAFVGTSDHDIVSAIAVAIAVLRDQPAPAPFSIKDKKEALLLLAHFVGDVHQPLHVGAVYLDAKGKRLDPDAGGHPLDPKTATRGGNSIDDGNTNLHAEWDAIPSTLKPTAIGSKMLTSAKGVAITPGDVTTWPAAWASDTIVASHTAFSGVSFTPTATAKPGHWRARFKDRTTYFAMKNRLQAAQLTKGGARLAQLLNAIWP